MWGLVVTVEHAAHIFRVTELGLDGSSKFLPDIVTPSFDQHRPREPENLTHMLCRDWNHLLSTTNAVSTAEAVLLAGFCSEIVVHLFGG